MGNNLLRTLLLVFTSQDLACINSCAVTRTYTCTCYNDTGEASWSQWFVHCDILRDSQDPTNTDTSVNDSFSVIVERRAQETKAKGICPFSGKVYY